jgi:hypothetical protein
MPKLTWSQTSQRGPLLNYHSIWLSVRFSSIDKKSFVRDVARFQVKVKSEDNHSNRVIEVHYRCKLASLALSATIEVEHSKIPTDCVIWTPCKPIPANNPLGNHQMQATIRIIPP